MVGWYSFVVKEKKETFFIFEFDFYIEGADRGWYQSFLIRSK